jgi:hypothetical protein
VVLGAALLLALLLRAGDGEQDRTVHPAVQEGTPPARTVLVADPARPLPKAPRVTSRDCLGLPLGCINGAEGITLAYRLEGVTPVAPTVAEVLTDVNCEPDRFGISHCVNELALPGGRRLTVRHDHDMHEFPCLTPGDRIRVLALT